MEVGGKHFSWHALQVAGAWWAGATIAVGVFIGRNEPHLPTGSELAPELLARLVAVPQRGLAVGR